LPAPVRSITRQAVAQAMIDQLESTEFLNQAPVIYRR